MNTTTPIVPLLLVTAALVLGSSCAGADWIDRTLVTVDVTGVWTGDGTRAPYGPIQVELALEQHGAKVNGNYRLVGGGPSRSLNAPSGPIEGTVAGDVFKFRQTNGALVGETTVAGDEMTGSMEAGVAYRLLLRRVSSTFLRSQ